MSEYIKTDENNLKNLADAIREKTGATELMTVGEMPEAIKSISLDDKNVKGTTYLPGNVTVYSGPYMSPTNLSTGRVRIEEGLEYIYTSELSYFYGNYNPLDGTNEADLCIIPTTVKEIHEKAFYGSYVKSLVVNENCTLYNSCFNNMTKLTKVWLPSSCVINVDKNNGYPFYKCDENLIIFTDAPSRPSTWATTFNCYTSAIMERLTVNYGSTYEDFLAA